VILSELGVNVALGQNGPTVRSSRVQSLTSGQDHCLQRKYTGSNLSFGLRGSISVVDDAEHSVLEDQRGRTSSSAVEQRKTRLNLTALDSDLANQTPFRIPDLVRVDSRSISRISERQWIGHLSVVSSPSLFPLPGSIS
jgi:hypothetical protein